MPTFPVRLDNISPLVKYSGSWRAGADDDEFLSNYSDGGTFAVTASNDARATISFYGTGITVYGGKRINHNKFTFSIDNTIPRTSDGYSEEPLFGQLLCSLQGLREGNHTLAIQNASESSDPLLSFLDIDWVEIQSSTEGAHNTDVDDFQLAWTYEPAESVWEHQLPTLVSNGQGSNSSHITASHGASATLDFVGTGLDLYGIVCGQCGEFSVTVDDREPEIVTARNSAHDRDNQLMYMSRGLVEGVHQMVIRNMGNEGTVLGIDRAVIHGNNPSGIAGMPQTSSIVTTSTEAPASTSIYPAGGQAETVQTTVGKRIPVIEIVCGVLAGLLLLLAALVFFLLWQRKRRNRRPGPVSHWRESIIPSSPMFSGTVSPFTMSQVQPATSPTSMDAVPFSSMLGIHPPAPASLRPTSPSPSLNPFEGPHVRVSTDARSDFSHDERGDTTVDRQTLLSFTPASIIRSPSPALVLHEAPPAYDPTSGPTSKVVDKKA